ncbi:MAG: hypothetical protein IPM76_00920 [Chloroflexi bacterium]|nr:hypothetical protein [Chloroflexota bacterium]
MKEQLTALINKEFRRLQWLSLAILVIAFFMLVAAFYFVVGVYLGNPMSNWMAGLFITILLFFGVTVLIFMLMSQSGERVDTAVNKIVFTETHEMEAANKRLKSLQELASIMRATLSFERVVEEALNVCNQALIDNGTARDALVSTVFLLPAPPCAPWPRAAFPAATWTGVFRAIKG